MISLKALKKKKKKDADLPIKVKINIVILHHSYNETDLKES